MALVKQHRTRRSVRACRRTDLGRANGGAHFDPRLARRYDRKLVRTGTGSIIWREPQVEANKS